MGSYKGIISRETLDSLRTYVLNKYSSAYSKSKVLNFAKGFLKYMTTMPLDPRLQAFELFLDKPKTLKERKNITERIVTKDDVEIILAAIQKTERTGLIDAEHLQQFAAFVLFGAYTGQRPYSTISQLRVEQFREALEHEKPTVHVEAAQDKIRMEHYVPLHPHLKQPLEVLCEGRESDKTHVLFRELLQVGKTTENTFVTVQTVLYSFRSAEVCRAVGRRYRLGSIKSRLYSNSRRSRRRVE